jgi:hypothetical protein
MEQPTNTDEFLTGYWIGVENASKHYPYEKGFNKGYTDAFTFLTKKSPKNLPQVIPEHSTNFFINPYESDPYKDGVKKGYDDRYQFDFHRGSEEGYAFAFEELH